MASQDPTHAASGRLGRRAILAIAGNIEDAKVAAIERCGVSREDLEAAVAWAAGQTGVMGKQHRPLSGAVAEAYDILTADEVFDDEGD